MKSPNSCAGGFQMRVQELQNEYTDFRLGVGCEFSPFALDSSHEFYFFAAQGVAS